MRRGMQLPCNQAIRSAKGFACWADKAVSTSAVPKRSASQQKGNQGLRPTHTRL
jgi:hypothetical protein